MPRLARLHESLPHRAIGRLPEIAAFGVLQVAAPADERQPHVGDWRADEHARMLGLLQMLHDEPLPIAVELVFAHIRGELQSAPPRKRLKQHVRFRVMAQRLKVAHAFDGRGDCLRVQDRPRAE